MSHRAMQDLLFWVTDGEALTTPAERAEGDGIWGTCPACGGDFTQTYGHRKLKVYCSDRCQRREYNYRRRCRECGARCRTTRCQTCSNRRVAQGRKKWTRDATLRALVEWIAEHGSAPTWAEWVEARMRPGGKIVQREFGSWAAGVDAASRYVELWESEIGAR